MEINKNELHTMIREYWATNHNDLTTSVSVYFLRRIGLTDREIRNWLDIPRGDDIPCVTQEDEQSFMESLENYQDDD